MDVLMAQGSRNEIFLVDGAAEEHFGSDADVRRFVVAMNDRSGPLGGGDGLYFVDERSDIPAVGFYNADGSTSALCGNGLRCVMRLLMDRRAADGIPSEQLQVRIGDNVFTGRQAADAAEGVPAIALDLPPVSFDATRVPVVTGVAEHVDTVIPALHPTLRFTALAVPNPHLVAIVEGYDEDLLVALGTRIAAGMPEFPEGINLSFLVALGEDDVFVRTYERGSALTPSCGSGNVASREVYSRLGHAPAERRVRLRNAGGFAYSWTDPRTGNPVLEGNASYGYRASLDEQALLHGGEIPVEIRRDEAEERAYALLWTANREAIAAAGITLPM